MEHEARAIIKRKMYCAPFREQVGTPPRFAATGSVQVRSHEDWLTRGCRPPRPSASREHTRHDQQETLGIGPDDTCSGSHVDAERAKLRRCPRRQSEPRHLRCPSSANPFECSRSSSMVLITSLTMSLADGHDDYHAGCQRENQIGAHAYRFSKIDGSAPSQGIR